MRCELSLPERTYNLCLGLCEREREGKRERGAGLLMCGANTGSITAHPSFDYHNPEEIL